MSRQRSRGIKGSRIPIFNTELPYLIALEVIRALDGYGVSVSVHHIRRVLKKQYELVKESTVQTGIVSTNDAKNVSEQTVQVSSTGEETYEPVQGQEPKTEAVKRLQIQLSDAAQELEQAKIR